MRYSVARLGEMAAGAAGAAGARLARPVVEMLETQRGVPGLLSQAAAQDVWHNRVDALVGDLDYAVEESINANLAKVVAEKGAAGDQYRKLMQQTALDPRDALGFNAASALYNLTHFFSVLKACPSNAVGVVDRSALLQTPDYSALVNSAPGDSVLLEKIVRAFGSWEEFVALFMASANGLTGEGYTWLVLRTVAGNTASDAFKNNATLAVVNTYNNGTPTALTKGQVAAVSSHMAGNGAYKARENSDKILSAEEAQSVEPFEYVGVPLLGIPSGPAFYLRDYGVYGKDAYLKNAFQCVDWDVVSARFKSHMTADRK